MKKIILLLAFISIGSITLNAKNTSTNKNFRCKNVQVLKKNNLKMFFPVTFCNSSGCESVNFNPNTHDMNDLMAWINWFLTEESF